MFVEDIKWFSFRFYSFFYFQKHINTALQMIYMSHQFRNEMSGEWNLLVFTAFSVHFSELYTVM